MILTRTQALSTAQMQMASIARDCIIRGGQRSFGASECRIARNYSTTSRCGSVSTRLLAVGCVAIATTATRPFSTLVPPRKPRGFGAYSPINRPPILAANRYENVLDNIGNTALIRLEKASELTGCNIYGKAEYANPGGSVKDRAALYIIKDAEERGILSPGNGIIVEGTAGNTGIGLTLVGNARGYNTIIVIADTQSKEKKDSLRSSGAYLLEVPAVPFKNPQNYVHVAERLSKLMTTAIANSSEHPKPGILYANQWDNQANRRAHFETTGPEIWAQTDGKIDAFCCATGTGGTLTGVTEFLRSIPASKLRQGQPPLCFITDPRGAALYRYYKTGELKSEGDSISEGIGQSRITGIMQEYQPDDVFEIHDIEALEAMYDLLQFEGLAVGTSSAINLAGAIQVAKKLGPGKNIVTVLADRADRYTAKLFNPMFLKSRNLPSPAWLDLEKGQLGQLETLLAEAMKVPQAQKPQI